MSGKLRREYLPFFLVVFTGLAGETCTDEDPILQTSLRLSKAQAEMNGVNSFPERRYRKEEDIQRLVSLCFEAGTALSQTLGLQIQKNLHSVMRHIRDDIISFACIRRGYTDMNESMHKETKTTYRSTNKQIHNIVFQLLKSSVPLRINSKEADPSYADMQAAERTLLTQNSRVDYPQAEKSALVKSNTRNDESSAALSIDNEIQEIRRKVCGLSPEDAEKAVDDFGHPSTSVSH